jgi:hypothetical protein
MLIYIIHIRALLGNFTIFSCFIIFFSRGFFFVSYFTTAGVLLLTIVLFSRVFYGGQHFQTDVGNLGLIFNRYKCISNPDNYQNSAKTIVSLPGFLSGLTSIIGNFGVVFIDQSYWQLNMSTSPKKSSVAFIIAGVLWMYIKYAYLDNWLFYYLFFN